MRQQLQINTFLLSLLKMEVQNLGFQIESKLSQKKQENPTYRKASAILTTLLQVSKTIPNFNHLYANNSKTMALYLSAGVQRLLKKLLQGDSQLEHNLDAYLLLLTMVVPQANVDALAQGGLINELRDSMVRILSKKDITPFVTRLSSSILSHLLTLNQSNTNLKNTEDRQLLLFLFETSLASPRGNVLSRQCSKLLANLVKANSSVTALIAQQSKLSLLNSLQEKRQLYFSNVKEVMTQLPIKLLNDICHKLATSLGQIDAADPNQENYLAQTYFFLQKMTPKLLPSTLEDIIYTLIASVPGGSQPERVQLSFLQLLYEATHALSQSNQQVANKILSPVVSTLIEQLNSGTKVAKFAANQLSFILSNCITPSLWRHIEDELSLDMINLDQAGRSFSKLICLMQSLLSSRFSNTKAVSGILSQFFSVLQSDAIGQCTSLIKLIVEERQSLHQKGFKRVMQSVLLAFGVEAILQLFPLSLTGDIGHSSFQEQNNLWLVQIIQKTERAESMRLFYQYIFPLIQIAKQHYQAGNLSKQRQEGYQLIENMFWRCIRTFSKTLDITINYEEVFKLIDSQIKNVNDSTQHQLAYSLQLLSQILAPVKYRSPAAEQLIKTIAGSLEVNSPNAKQLLNSLKGLSRIAPQDYVKRVFDKNIQKCISLCEQKALTKQQQKNLKNLQILMAVNSSIELSDPSVTTKYRISREQLLLKLVSQLMNSSGAFQKKGYKYINQTLSAAPRSLYLQILELFESEVKVQNGSKHHRLSVIGKLWRWLNSEGLEENLEKIIGFIKSHLPQILLSLRDSNKGARNQAIKILGEFSGVMNQMGLIQNFVETVCVGLIGDRSEMKLATLSGLGFIIGKGYCSEDIFKELLEIVLLLLKEKKQELYKGVVEFCKRGILGFSLDKQKLYLPSVLQQLFQSDEEGKLEHRSILRHFLLRLVKKHGKDQIDLMIPAAHRKMLSHAIKLQNRQKRKKREKNIARRQQLQQQKLQREQNQSSSDSERQEQQQQAAEDNQAMDVQGELQDLDNTNNLLLKYDLEKEQFHFQQEQLKKFEQQKKKLDKNQDQITFDEAGIMIIEDRKRQRVQPEEEKEEEQPANQKDNLNFKKKSKTQIHQVKESGDTYKSNRAGGDVTLKDKPQPYAFIQFSSKALNKRFKKRAEHVFENLFQKKEGGLRGLKSRIVGNH